MKRLDYILAHLGFGSRKIVKEYIRKGYVLVNGEVIRNDDYKVDEINDEINVFNEDVKYLSNVYIMLNKPKDVISATFDNYQKTVIDLVSEYQSYNIFPVGRLDIDTTGLLLLTNDGKLAHNLLSPKSHVAKKYEVTFTGVFEDSYIEVFKKGLHIDDYVTKPAILNYVDPSHATVIIYEGKFHQVKKMFEKVHLKVIELKRVEMGPLKLDTSLKLGEYRLLTKEEIDALNGN